MGKRVIMGTVQYINIEDVPDEFRDWVWEQLPINGGNVLSVDKGTSFGDWLIKQGFIFEDKATWEHLVVFR